MEREPKRGHVPGSFRSDGITHVGLKVSDAERARRFYREILGLEGEPRGRGIVYVLSGRDTLILYEEEHGATDSHFGFNVATPALVDQWKDWLVQNRVPIAEDVTEDGYRSVKFQDPDGHWVEIFYEG